MWEEIIALTQFSVESGYFVVTFLGREFTPGKVFVAPELRAQLDQRQKKVVDFVLERGRINRAECVALLRVSRNTAARDLTKLVELGVLVSKGKGPAAYYALIGS